jgi:uncharacterized cupredoxin-like copper-binding protein
VQRKLIATALAIGLAVTVAACGGGNSVQSAGGARTIDIDMRDNDFSTASLQVKAGEQVQFVFHNKGAVVHDAFIGDDAAQAAHELEMRASSSDTQHGHDGDAVTVEPGQTGTLSHTFANAGVTVIGCHELNHYALGMRIRVTVT